MEENGETEVQTSEDPNTIEGKLDTREEGHYRVGRFSDMLNDAPPLGNGRSSETTKPSKVENLYAGLREQ